MPLNPPKVAAVMPLKITLPPLKFKVLFCKARVFDTCNVPLTGASH